MVSVFKYGTGVGATYAGAGIGGAAANGEKLVVKPQTWPFTYDCEESSTHAGFV